MSTITSITLILGILPNLLGLYGFLDTGSPHPIALLPCSVGFLLIACVVIEDYRNEYNTFRPHSKLGYLSPATFAARKSAPSPSPVGLRPPCVGDGQHNNNQLETKSSLKD